jgi:hypothetical protein
MTLAIDPLAGILFVFLIGWLIALSALLFRLLGHYNRLTGGGNVRTLKEVLEGMLRKDGEIQRDIKRLQEVVTQLASDGQYHVQRVGIVRFNPFADTGGAQSFTMAILDKKDNGVVMTSLYGRTGNRWYVKEVAEGAGIGVELSQEEKAAIQKAYGQKTIRH